MLDVFLLLLHFSKLLLQTGPKNKAEERGTQQKINLSSIGIDKKTHEVIYTINKQSIPPNNPLPIYLSTFITLPPLSFPKKKPHHVIPLILLNPSKLSTPASLIEYQTHHHPYSSIKPQFLPFPPPILPKNILLTYPIYC